MYNASDLKKGLKIQIDGAPWAITEFEFCKPGKGTALYRCKMKNMINGAGMEKTYRPTDKSKNPTWKNGKCITPIPKAICMFSAMLKPMKKCV